MEQNLNLEDFHLDEIESIELIGEEDTIDITVDDTHMFFANDIYTHNSSIKSEVVEADQMSGSIKKGMIGHFIMSVAKTLDQKESGTATLAILKSRFGKDGIVFQDIIYDNSRVNIEIKKIGKTFTQNQKDNEFSNQNRLNEMFNAAKMKKNIDLGLTDSDLEQNN